MSGLEPPDHYGDVPAATDNEPAEITYGLCVRYSLVDELRNVVFDGVAESGSSVTMTGEVNATLKTRERDSRKLAVEALEQALEIARDAVRFREDS